MKDKTRIRANTFLLKKLGKIHYRKSKSTKLTEKENQKIDSI